MEDDLDLCQSIQQELMKNGYSVDCCNDGETAMLYALNTDYGYDLAIVDRMLPVIDGLTIIKAMRRKNNQLPRCKHSSTVLGSYVAAHSTCLSLLLPQERKRGMRICLSLLLHIIE